MLHAHRSLLVPSVRASDTHPYLLVTYDGDAAYIPQVDRRAWSGTVRDTRANVQRSGSGRAGKSEGDLLSRRTTIDRKVWCRGTELNRRRAALQAAALPTELPRRTLQHVGKLEDWRVG